MEGRGGLEWKAKQLELDQLDRFCFQGVIMQYWIGSRVSGVDWIGMAWVGGLG